MERLRRLGRQLSPVGRHLSPVGRYLSPATAAAPARWLSPAPAAAVLPPRDPTRRSSAPCVSQHAAMGAGSDDHSLGEPPASGRASPAPGLRRRVPGTGRLVALVHVHLSHRKHVEVVIRRAPCMPQADAVCMLRVRPLTSVGGAARDCHSDASPATLPRYIKRNGEGMSLGMSAE